MYNSVTSRRQGGDPGAQWIYVQAGAAMIPRNPTEPKRGPILESAETPALTYAQLNINRAYMYSAPWASHNVMALSLERLH